MPVPLLLYPALTAAGSLIGGALGRSGNQRVSENAQTNQQNSLIASIYGTRQNALMDALRSGSQERLAQGSQDLDRRQFALNAPSARARQSVRGSLLQNLQPLQLSGLPDRVSSRIPTQTGGLTPAAFNSDTRALGGELTRAALMDQLRGDSFAPMTQTNFQEGILPAPQLEALQRSGLFEQILGSLGFGASLVGGVGGAVQGARAPNYDDQLYGYGGGG